MIDLSAEYATAVTEVARSIGKSYQGYTSIQDVEQHLWLEIYAKSKYFTEYHENKPLIRAALRRQAHVFCEKERRQVVHDDPHDLYSPRAVKALLEDVFDYEDWTSFSQKNDGMPRNKRIEATSDRLAMLVDVKIAIDKLSQRNYSIIIAKYKLDYSDTQLATMLEIAEASVPTTVDRAVNALTKVLNPTDTDREYVGGRRVKSNAAARAELDAQW